jgi:hypothetical protein
MTREIRRDLEHLKEFIKSYSLNAALANEDFNQLLSKQHKRYFALLIVVAEMNHQFVTPFSISVNNHAELNKIFMDYIAESVSDLGSALFVWMHGTYKAARMTLRSGIENFLKAIGFIEFQQIIQSKNVYEVIDLAGEIDLFKVNANKLMFEELKQIYGMLCATVHTASIQQMAHVTALGYFPHFDFAVAQEFAKIFFRVSQLFTFILCLMFKDCYLCMHYKNQDIVVNVLDDATKKTLQGL